MTTKWDVVTALKTSALPSPARHIMLWLIDAADQETCRIPAEFSPSLTQLSGWSGLSRASVAEQLNLLEHFGWVRRDRPTVEAARSKKARTRYRVAIGRDVSRGEIRVWKDSQKPKRTGPERGLVQEVDQSSSPGGGLSLVQEVDQASPGRGLELVQEVDTIPPPPLTPHPPIEQPADEWHEFWEIYPQKTGKLAARREWNKALGHATAADIIEGAKRYRDDPNRVPKFTYSPERWLRDGRWDDEPTPSLAATGTTGHRSFRSPDISAYMRGL